MNNQNTTVGYVFPNADKKLKEKLLALRTGAVKLFSTLGKQGKPAQDDTDILSAVASIKAGHENLFSEEMHDIKPEVHHAEFMTLKAHTEDALATLATEEDTLTHNIIATEHTLEGKTRPAEQRREPWAVAVLVVFYIGETVLNALAFELSGDMPLWAYLLGACTTGIEAVLAYHIARNLERLEAEGKRMDIKTAGLITVVAGIVVSMTMLRGYALRELGGSFPTWAYAFINAGLLFATVIFSKRIWPSGKEQAETAQLRSKFDEIDAWKERLAQIPAEKASLQKTLAEGKHAYEVVMSHVRHTGETISASYRETVELAKAENKIMRSDKKNPACFRKSTPALNITIFKPKSNA